MKLAASVYSDLLLPPARRHLPPTHRGHTITGVVSMLDGLSLAVLGCLSLFAVNR
ncbi:MAG: hypothetical protein AAGA32_17345 [Pseudomonadota bacterium]